MSSVFTNLVLAATTFSSASSNRNTYAPVVVNPETEGVCICVDTSATTGTEVDVELCYVSDDGDVIWSTVKTFTAGDRRSGHDGNSANYICPPQNFDIPPFGMPELGSQPATPDAANSKGCLLAGVPRLTAGTCRVSGFSFAKV